MRVKYVEADSVVTTVATQNAPPWGLDRAGITLTAPLASAS